MTNIQNDIFVSLQSAVEAYQVGSSTLRSHIRSGSLPAFKIRGRVHLKIADLDAHFSPKPVPVQTETLREWAQRMAADAPAFSPEQRDVIISAFSASLTGRLAS